MSSTDLTYDDVLNDLRNGSSPSAWRLSFLRRRENETTTEQTTTTTTTDEIPTSNATEIHIDVITPETDVWVNIYYQRMLFSIILVLLGLCIATIIFRHVKQRKFGKVSRSRPPLGFRKYGRMQEMYPLDKCTDIAISPTATVLTRQFDF